MEELETLRNTWQGEPLEDFPLTVSTEGTVCLSGTLKRLDQPIVQVTDEAFGTEFPSVTGKVTAWTDPEKNRPQGEITVLAREADLEGDFYNASGYLSNAPKKLCITLDAGTKLRGTISATEAKAGENGPQHQCFSNGGNEVAVTLTGGAVWTVEGAGYLTSLRVDKGCRLSGMVLLDDRQLSLQKGKTYEGLLLVLPE